MIVHLPAIAFDVVILRFSFCDLEVCSRDDDVGCAGAAGPFLAVEAVAAAGGLVGGVWGGGRERRDGGGMKGGGWGLKGVVGVDREERGRQRAYRAVTWGSPVYSYATAPHMQEPVVMFAVEMLVD